MPAQVAVRYPGRACGPAPWPPHCGLSHLAFVSARMEPPLAERRMDGQRRSAPSVVWTTGGFVRLTGGRLPARQYGCLFAGLASHPLHQPQRYHFGRRRRSPARKARPRMGQNAHCHWLTCGVPAEIGVPHKPHPRALGRERTLGIAPVSTHCLQSLRKAAWGPVMKRAHASKTRAGQLRPRRMPPVLTRTRTTAPLAPAACMLPPGCAFVCDSPVGKPCESAQSVIPVHLSRLSDVYT